MTNESWRTLLHSFSSFVPAPTITAIISNNSVTVLFTAYTVWRSSPPLFLLDRKKKKRETREKESKASNAIFPLSDWHCTNNIVDGTLDLQDEDDGEKKLLEDLQEEIRRRGRQVKFRIDPAQTDTRLLLRLTGRVCNWIIDEWACLELPTRVIYHAIHPGAHLYGSLWFMN